LILIDRLCFDRYKIDNIENAPKVFKIEGRAVNLPEPKIPLGWLANCFGDYPA
jgi:hypothetical protein